MPLNNTFKLWFNKLKINVLSKDINNLRDIADDIPDITKFNLSIDTKKEILFYLKKAENILQLENNNLSEEMKKNKDHQKLANSLLVIKKTLYKYI
jgi:hypothetical protein